MNAATAEPELNSFGQSDTPDESGNTKAFPEGTQFVQQFVLIYNDVNRAHEESESENCLDLAIIKKRENEPSIPLVDVIKEAANNG